MFECLKRWKIECFCRILEKTNDLFMIFLWAFFVLLIFFNKGFYFYKLRNGKLTFGIRKNLQIFFIILALNFIKFLYQQIMEMFIY